MLTCLLSRILSGGRGKGDRAGRYQQPNPCIGEQKLGHGMIQIRSIDGHLRPIRANEQHPPVNGGGGELDGFDQGAIACRGGDGVEDLPLLLSAILRLQVYVDLFPGGE